MLNRYGLIKAYSLRSLNFWITKQSHITQMIYVYKLELLVIFLVTNNFLSHLWSMILLASFSDNRLGPEGGQAATNQPLHAAHWRIRVSSRENKKNIRALNLCLFFMTSDTCTCDERTDSAIYRPWQFEISRPYYSI